MGTLILGVSCLGYISTFRSVVSDLLKSHQQQDADRYLLVWIVKIESLTGLESYVFCKHCIMLVHCGAGVVTVWMIK